MRDYVGFSVSDIDDPSLRDKLAAVDFFLRDLSKAIGRIQKGQVPDGSGDSIVDTNDGGLFLKLLGRPNNQDAHGGTAPGGSLTLSSTVSPTKGLVYLGDAHSAAYDETNNRIGIGTTSPTAKLHIHVGGAISQAAAPNSSESAAGWVNQATATPVYPALADNSDSTFAWHDTSSSQTYAVRLATATSPGITSGHIFTIRAKITDSSSSRDSRVSVTLDSGGSSWLAGQTGLLSNGFVDYPFTVAASAVSAINYSLINFGMTNNNLVGPFDQQVQVSKAYLTIPPIGGGTGADTIVVFDDGTETLSLNFVSDGGSSEALAVTGTGKFMIGSGVPFLLATAGSVNDLWARADSIGTGGWANASAVVSAVASGLPTRIQHRWEANGYYVVDNEVDGAYIPPHALTLTSVNLYRRSPGSSGTTSVDLLKNGVTMLSALASVGASGGASATGAGTLSVTSVAALDRITVSANAVEAGVPQDWALVIEGY